MPKQEKIQIVTLNLTFEASKNAVKCKKQHLFLLILPVIVRNDYLCHII